MSQRLFLVVLFSVLANVKPAWAQQSPPLQFKMVDVSQAVRRFDSNALVRSPQTPKTRDFGFMFPKISLAPFPPRTKAAQLPSSFKVPGTTNPVQGRFPTVKAVTP